MSGIEIRRVWQKKGHCGPTSLEMMLSLYGLAVSQEAIAEAAGVEETIGENGSRIDELALAIEALVPGYVLMAKYDSSVEDLESLVEEYGLPTGIEWQGVFVDDEGAPFEEGHYSVVVKVDRDTGAITIADPERRSALIDGMLSFSDFEERWWEDNDVPSVADPTVMEVICNKGLLFVVVPEEQTSQMQTVGLQPVSLSLMRAYQIPRRRG
jgi:hypothetical protein